MIAARILKTGTRALAAFGFIAAAACDDGLGPQFWDPTPDSTAVYSLSRPELIGQPSAYDFVSLRRVVIEAAGETGNWDVALGEEGGVFKLYPSGSLPGISSRAGIATTTSPTLEGLERAPGDSAAYSRVPITAQIGTVYAVRSRTASCVGFGSGTYYGKFVILSIDPVAGAARIAAVRNPYCNDRSLIPPDN